MKLYYYQAIDIDSVDGSEIQYDYFVFKLLGHYLAYDEYDKVFYSFKYKNGDNGTFKENLTYIGKF
jgi:hypothetical protein